MKCLNPKYIKLPSGRHVFVPCGKCQGCLVEYSKVQTYKVNTILSNSPYNIFTTLTYDNEHIPYVLPFSNKIVNVGVDKFGLRMDEVLFDEKDSFASLPVHPITNFSDPSAVGVLYRPHLSKFIKNIKKYLNSIHYESEFAFYFCGEYGSQKFRPHYHGVISCQFQKQAYEIRKIIPSLWSMCSSSLTEEYTKFISGNNFQYLSSYISSRYYLPAFYHHRLFRPFSVGNRFTVFKFNKREVEAVREYVRRGIVPDFIFYDGTKKRTPDNLIVPQNYLHSLFPKLPNFGTELFKHGFAVADGCFADCIPQFERFRNSCKRFLKLFGLVDNFYNRHFYVLCNYALNDKYASDKYKRFINKLPKYHDYKTFCEYLLNYSDTFEDVNLNVNFGSESFNRLFNVIDNFVSSHTLNFDVDVTRLTCDYLRFRLPSRYFHLVESFIRENEYVLKVKHYNSVKQNI